MFLHSCIFVIFEIPIYLHACSYENAWWCVCMCIRMWCVLNSECALGQVYSCDGDVSILHSLKIRWHIHDWPTAWDQRAFHLILSTVIRFFWSHACILIFRDSWQLISNLNLIVGIQYELGGTFWVFWTSRITINLCVCQFLVQRLYCWCIGWLCVCYIWRLWFYRVAFLSQDLQVSPCATRPLPTWL